MVMVSGKGEAQARVDRHQSHDGPTRAPTFALQAEVLVAFVGVGNVSKRVRATECKKAV